MIDHKKRFYAYLIDISIILIIIFLFHLIIPRTEEQKRLNNELVELNETYISKDISISQYYFHFSLIIHDMDTADTSLSLLNAFLIIGYFVVYPFYKKGQTFGQKKMKIKVVNNRDELPSIEQLMIRNLVINGLLYILVSLSMLYIVSRQYYFTLITILGIIQLFIVFYSTYMVIYKKDKKGLQDILSNTFFKEEV